MSKFFQIIGNFVILFPFSLFLIYILSFLPYIEEFSIDFIYFIYPSLHSSLSIHLIQMLLFAFQLCLPILSIDILNHPIITFYKYVNLFYLQNKISILKSEKIWLKFYHLQFFQLYFFLLFSFFQFIYLSFPIYFALISSPLEFSMYLNVIHHFMKSRC